MDVYDKLFLEYVEALTTARSSAEKWWSALEERETSLAASRQAARNRLTLRWPCGPVSHPFVIRVYRQFYVACERLNQSRAAAEETKEVGGAARWGAEGASDADQDRVSRTEVPPHVFCVEWLAGRHQSLREFLDRFVFSPIGGDDLGLDLSDEEDEGDTKAVSLEFVSPRTHPFLRDWRTSVARLLAAPSDLAVDLPASSVLLNGADASRREDFRRYVAELDETGRRALAWWNRILQHTARRLRSPERALASVWQSRPAGPAAYPDMVSVVRRHWLLCDARNGACEAAARIAPQRFVLGWLDEANLTDLAKLLACMPYWPLGLDAAGKWV